MSNLLDAALELLEVLLSKFPEPTQLASAWLQRAECLAAKARNDEALDSYRAALAAQRSLPSGKTYAHLGFGELVLTLQQENLYEEVLIVLQEFSGNEAFPILEYRLNVIRALIANNRGLPDAKKYARLALEAAIKTESPFRYHRNLGLVGAQKLEIEVILKKLAAD